MSFAEMADMSHEIRETRDALDAAGNTDTSTAIGKVIFFFRFSALLSLITLDFHNVLNCIAVFSLKN